MIRAALGSILLTALLLSGCASTSSIEARSSMVDYHYRLGMAHLEDNNFQAGLVEFRTARKIDPKSAKVLFAMGHTLFQQGEYAAAEEVMRELLDIHPNDGKTLNYLGTIYERQGRLDDAVDAFQQALSKDDYVTPQFPLSNLARIYIRQGKKSQAVEVLTSATRKVPEYFPARADLARLYMDMGEWQKAADQWQAFMDLRPDMLEARYYLGRAYMGLKQNDNARTELQKFLLKADQSNPLVAEANALLDVLNAPSGKR